MREDWTSCAFSDVLEIISGKSQKEVESIGGPYPIYGSGGEMGRASDFRCPPETTVVGRKGTINDPLFVKEAFWNIDTAFGLVAKPCLNTRFLYFFCRNFNFLSLDRSTAIPSLTKGNLYEIQMPVPPLAEQQAIVAKLDGLFSELDKGVEELKSAQEKLKVYRQAVLKKAFEGELTKDWRAKQTDLPTGEELLDQIRGRRAEYHTQQLDDWAASVKAWQADGKPGKKPRKPSKSPPLKELGEDFLETLGPLPNSWIWVTNDELMFYVTSGSRDWKRYYSEDCGAYFVRTQDIKTNSLDIRKCAFVDLPEDVEGKRSLIETGDLLMTITGANVGKIAHIQSDVSEAYVSQSVALMKYVEKRMGNYLHYYFQSSSHGAKHIGAMVYGVGRPVLSLEDMREAPVALCTLNEQIEIVRILDSLLSTCDKLDSDIQKGLDRKDTLRQSLLMKAFRGELLSENELISIQ